MGGSLIGFAIGFVLGAASGTAGGAFAGGILGMMLGAGAHGVRWLWAHRGDAPTVERHRVMCTPYGRLADIEFAGDLDSRKWLDVKRCSLLRVADEVTCDKRCIHRMNASGVKPGDRCDCEAEAAAAT